MYFVWCSILKRRGSGVLIPSVMVDGTWFHIEQNSLELSSSIKYSNGSSVLTSAHRVEAVCKMAEMPYCFVFYLCVFGQVFGPRPGQNYPLPNDAALAEAPLSVLCLDSHVFIAVVPCRDVDDHRFHYHTAQILQVANGRFSFYRCLHEICFFRRCVSWLWNLFFCSCCISGANLWIGGTQAWDVERLASRQ